MPVVPTTSGRQVESRGVQSAGLQTFSQPGIGDAFVRAGTEAIDVLGQAKQRANIALAQEASLNLSQISSDLLNNPETGLLNLKGKNAIGKGHEYTQQFDAQVEQLAMSLPDEQARNAFMQQAQQQRIQFTTQAGRHEIGQINAYEEGQFQATLLNNGKNAAALYGDNAAYVLANKQTFQQIEEYGAAHGWSDEQIQAKKIEFKEKVADAALSQWSANNATAFIQSNGELSDTAAGARRAVTDSGSSERVRGIRNNNPGNLEYSKTNPWVGQTGDDGRFAKFETPEHGIRALGRNLMSYQRQGIDTVSEIINRWAPPTDKNDTMSYIKAVCEQLGVSADEPLDASNPDTLKALCAAIIHHENGSQPYSDQQLTAGVSAALGLSTIPTNTKRYTGNAAFDAASPEAQASFMRQADQLRRQQQAEYKTMIDSQVRDATAAYMRGVEFPNPPGEADFIAAYGVREGNLRYTEFKNTQIAGQYIGSFRNMPTSSITAYVEQLRPDTGETGEGYAARAALYDNVVSAANQVIKQRQSDPVQFSLASGQTKPIDMSNKDNFGQSVALRAAQVSDLAKSYGTPLTFFSKDEANQIGVFFRDAPVSDVIGKLDRKYYIRADGQLMNDAELSAFLGEAYNTIATGGLNKLTDTGMRISGARANRGNASRQIHFKDADSYLQYQQLYGDRSLWEIMVGHLEGISKDIALVETYGPNPDHVFRSLLDQVKAETATANPSKTGKVERLANNTENLYNFISGKTQPVANPHIARWSDNIRNWLVASRLGSALLSSFSDLGTMYLSAKVTNLPMNQLFRNQLEAMDPTNRTELARARRAGLAMESLLGSVNRWAMDNMGPSVSRWAATAVMRASGLTAWSDAHKRAYGVTMMGSLGEVVSRTPDLRSLDDSDFRILKSKGITDTDWSVWKLAQQEDWGNGNNTMLTPESIMRIPDSAVKHLGEPERVKFEATRKLLGAVTEEVDMAVITPGAREQLITGSGIQRGTWKGELTRSVFLFKSFPISVVMRHWSRAMGMPSAGGRAAYIATFIASTTILGALSQQLNDLASGRNPREMTGEDAAKFWLGALLKGGGLGLYGDFLLSDHTRYGSGALASMLGPVAGLVDDVVKIAQGIPLNAVEGKSEQTGGDLVKLGKGLMPGANLWYLKAALDHMIFNQMQEYFSPGYLRKMEQRSKKEFNQTYWWRPQDVTPQ